MIHFFPQRANSIDEAHPYHCFDMTGKSTSGSLPRTEKRLFSLGESTKETRADQRIPSDSCNRGEGKSSKGQPVASRTRSKITNKRGTVRFSDVHLACIGAFISGDRSVDIVARVEV